VVTRVEANADNKNSPDSGIENKAFPAFEWPCFVSHHHWLLRVSFTANAGPI
jgi:hypothetical protein